MDSVPCAVGITFILSSIIISVLKIKKDKFNDFTNLLDEGQKVKYEEIISERIKVYYFGAILGIIIGGIYYYYNKKDKNVICKVLSIFSVVKLGFYYFYPKKPLMLKHLTNKKQVDAWTNNYSSMKNKWKQSMILGFIGYLFISFSIK